jgi:hypothetical protein
VHAGTGKIRKGLSGEIVIPACSGMALIQETP